MEFNPMKRIVAASILDYVNLMQKMGIKDLSKIRWFGPDIF